MGWQGEASFAALERALDRYDRPTSEDLCGDLVGALRDAGGRLPEAWVRSVLKKLRNNRYFDLVERAADVAIQAGSQDPTVRLLYTQALLDQSRLTAALTVLDGLAQAKGLSPTEAAEARGLRGRAYKQLYVDAGGAPVAVARVHLEKATEAYLGTYRESPEAHAWHGINAVALLQRGEHDGIPIAAAPDSRDLAREILERIEGKRDDGRADTWDFATAAEACVALGRAPREIARWLGWYAFGGASAFALASTERQLREVWGLGPDASPGREAFAILRAALAHSKGGAAAIEPGAFDQGALGQLPTDQLEAVLGTDGVRTYRWYLTGLERCRTVARVEKKTGDGFGTGFLIENSSLSPELGDGWLLLTNAHVVTDEEEVFKALSRNPPLRPEQARVSFTAAPGATYDVEVLWTSPPGRLDASVLRLRGVPGEVPTFPLNPHLPVIDEVTPARVYVIGHPRGGELSLSLNDNLLLDHDAEAARIHYRAPTEPGSSGSPVFNSDWELIGLHHAGGTQLARLHGRPGTYAANEGIWIEAIRAALQRELPSRRRRARPPGRVRTKATRSPSRRPARRLKR